MAPITAMKNVTLTTGNTSTTFTTSVTNTIIVIFVLMTAFCIGSMCHGLYVRKIPFNKYVLTSLNPLVLLFVWPFHLLNFVCGGFSKARGKQDNLPDVDMQQKSQWSAIMQHDRIDRNLAEAFDIEQTPTPSPTHPVWNRPVYAPAPHLCASSSLSESQAVRSLYIPFSHHISPEDYTYNNRRSTSLCIPHCAYNFPTSSPYAASERNFVDGENAAYLEASPSNSQVMKNAFANVKEVEHVRKEVEKIEAEPVRVEADARFVESAFCPAPETLSIQKTSIEDFSHIRPLGLTAESFFSIGTGRPELIHPVPRPASVAGFILQCSENDSSDGEDEESLEQTQAEAEAAQRFQNHAHLQELKETRYQADIEAAVAGLRKQLELQTILDTNTTFDSSVGTMSKTPSTASFNYSTSSEFPFRSGSAPTFAAVPGYWEAEDMDVDVDEQALLDPVRASVVQMFKVLPVQRCKGWKGASLVSAQSLRKFTTGFDVGLGPDIDPGPNGFGIFVESPEQYTSRGKGTMGRIQAKGDVAQQFQPLTDRESLAEVEESLPDVTMDFNVEFGFNSLVASPVTSDRETSSRDEDTLEVPIILGPDVEFVSVGSVSKTPLLALVPPASNFSDACRKWAAEEALSGAAVKVLKTSDSEGVDGTNPYTQLGSKSNTQSTNSAYPSIDTVSDNNLVEEAFPSVNDFLSSIGDVFDLSDMHKGWKPKTELRESIIAMFASDPIQHDLGQGASVVSASLASSSSFETYPGSKSKFKSNSSTTSEDRFSDFSEVCFAARFLPENRITAAEMNALCEAPDENESPRNEGPVQPSTEEFASAIETKDVQDVPEAEQFLATAMPVFRSQQTPSEPRHKQLKSMVQRWELGASADRVPNKRFVPDWKFEEDMAR